MADGTGPSNPKNVANLKNMGLPILGGGVRAEDPVCGMSVDPGKAAGKQEFGGKTYYFCSKRCAERFAAEPQKFLAAPGTAGMGSAAASENAGEVLSKDSAASSGGAGAAGVGAGVGSGRAGRRRRRCGRCGR